MFRKFIILNCFLFFAGCLASGIDQPENEGPIVASAKGNLRFKDGERYGRMLADAFALPREALCTELGRFDCVSVAHRIALGGVDAYQQQIFEPMAQAAVTSPLAIERVAISTCEKLAERDLATPIGAVVYRDIAGDEGRRASLGRLYRRVLKRNITQSEAETLALFHDEVAASSEAPAHDWAVLTCLIVTTSVEALFY